MWMNIAIVSSYWTKEVNFIFDQVSKKAVLSTNCLGSRVNRGMEWKGKLGGAIKIPIFGTQFMHILAIETCNHAQSTNVCFSG